MAEKLAYSSQSPLLDALKMVHYGIIFGLLALSVSAFAGSVSLFAHPFHEKCSKVSGVKIDDYNIITNVQSLFEGKYFDYTSCVAKENHLVDENGNINNETLMKSLDDYGYFGKDITNKISVCLLQDGGYKQKLECVVNEMNSFNVVNYPYVNSVHVTMDEFYSILLKKPAPVFQIDPR